MLAIGPRGLFDWRLSNDLIPWSAIRKMDEKSGYMDRRYFVVELEPSFDRIFTAKPLARMLRVMCRVFRISGYVIVIGGIVDPKQFAQALNRYCPQWRPQSASVSSPDFK